MSIVSSRLRRPVFTIVATTAILTGMLIAAPAASAAVLTQNLGPDLTAAQLANALVGDGVTVSNAQFTGTNVAGGTFSGGGTGPGAIIGFGQGVVLSTGAIATVPGPNNSGSATTNNVQPGDPSLDTLLPVGQASQDAAVLTFNFVPDASSVSFSYVFSSEEYNEYVGLGFNDVFGFFVNGVNCATVGGNPVSVDTINTSSNSALFRNNVPVDPNPAPIDTQMDGLTTVLNCTAAVTANQANTMKLAIGDVGDGAWDSNVFIEAGSLTTEPPGDAPGAPTNVTATPGDGSAVVNWTAPGSDGGSAIDGYTVICAATGNPDDVHSATVGGATLSAPISGLTNGVEYSCVVRAHNANGDSDPSAASAPFTPAAGQAQFSMTVNTSVGGILLINPEGPANLGTTGKIKIPPQGGPGQQVVVTATLFGIPGETDATCGGNVCIGQGIEWSVSNPSAIKKMRVKFIESKTLTHGGSAHNAIAYKDGVPVANCPVGVSDKNKPKPCVVWRYDIPGGGWQVTLLVDGSDPKGRI